MVGRAKAQRVLGLVLAHWLADPGPGVFSCSVLWVLELAFWPGGG